MGTAASHAAINVAESAEALELAEQPQAAGTLFDKNPTIVFIAIGHARFPTTPIGLAAE